MGRSGRPFDGGRVSRALIEFLATERSGGLALFIATAIALAWANSPWHAAYESVWRATAWLSPHAWVNDALMAVLFFVAGLEIKREFATGELREPRRAALPVCVRLGGGAAKPAGVLGAIAVARHSGLGALPADLTPRRLAGGACLTGIGITVALLVTELSLPGTTLQDEAKLGVLAASPVAAALDAALLGTGRYPRS